MVLELTQTELDCLSTCLEVATENLIFYELNYQAVRIIPHKLILGRLLAQKKEFIEVIEVLFKAQPDLKFSFHKSIKNEDMPLTKDDPNQREIQMFRPMVNEHEKRFKHALEITISKTRDPARGMMLTNHLAAAQIGLDAIIQELQSGLTVL